MKENNFFSKIGLSWINDNDSETTCHNFSRKFTPEVLLFDLPLGQLKREFYWDMGLMFQPHR